MESQTICHQLTHSQFNIKHGKAYFSGFEHILTLNRQKKYCLFFASHVRSVLRNSADQRKLLSNLGKKNAAAIAIYEHHHANCILLGTADKSLCIPLLRISYRSCQIKVYIICKRRPNATPWVNGLMTIFTYCNVRLSKYLIMNEGDIIIFSLLPHKTQSSRKLAKRSMSVNINPFSPEHFINILTH